MRFVLLINATRKGLVLSVNLALTGAQSLDIIELLRDADTSVKIYSHEALDDLLSEPTERCVSTK